MKPTPQHIFGALLRAHGITQRELAEQADVSQATISRIIKQGQEPSPETSAKIASAFGLHAKDIERWTQEVNTDSERKLEEALQRLIESAGIQPNLFGSTETGADSGALSIPALAALDRRLAEAAIEDRASVIEVVDSCVRPDDLEPWVVRGLPPSAAAVHATSVARVLYDPHALTTPPSESDLVRVMKRDDNAIEVDISRYLAAMGRHEALAEQRDKRHTARAAQPERAPEALAHLYEAATIEVIVGDGNHVFSAAPEADELDVWPFDADQVHVLTGEFPAGPLLTKAEGEAQTARLELQVRRQHPRSTIWQAVARGTEVDPAIDAWAENSIAISGITDDTAHQLAVQYGQRAWFTLTPDGVSIRWASNPPQPH